ncbi:MAG: glutathione peroxidase [Cellvibrionaceae bacterium]
MNQSFKQLQSTNTINIYDEHNSKHLLIVNTAIYCGFTHQFTGLEALHQRYKQEGLRVVDLASNDFRQAAKGEAEAASICDVNYGVTFTMMPPISVKGSDAHPLFKAIAAKPQEPSWNFNNFLVGADDHKIKHFALAPPQNRIKSMRLLKLYSRADL